MSLQRMKTEDKNSTHCPEVDRLLKGKAPFVTRHGITVIVLVWTALSVFLYFSEGRFHELLSDIVGHTIRSLSFLP